MKWLCGAAGLLVLISSSSIAAARAASPEAWVEVRSPHFTVVSDAPVGEARTVARRFERVRSVFKKAFPGMRVYPDLPIIILAVRNRTVYQSLEPPAWKGQGQAHRVGMMLRNPDKNFILLLLGVAGENPYHVVYHEYAHLVLEDDFPNIPLWLNEGLAEFYGNSEIGGKTVRLGLPSKTNLRLLQTHSLLPLKTLFTVNHSSPYYNEENKGTIFYAEAWALTDYLMFLTPPTQKGPIDEYLRLVGSGADPVRAAVTAFGDLSQLETNLREYITRSAFGYYRVNAGHLGGKDQYPAESLSLAQSDAVRGDFMARTGNLALAKGLLQDALKQNPQPAAAMQSMGLVALHEGQNAEAAEWFHRAALSCTQCELAWFYDAVARMQGDPDEAEREAITHTFRAFISFNPAYAPAYASLASFEAKRRANLGAARDLAAKASRLDPRNLPYRFLESEILLKMGDDSGALKTAHEAVNTAVTPQEKSQAYVFLGTIEQRIEEGKKY